MKESQLHQAADSIMLADRGLLLSIVTANTAIEDSRPRGSCLYTRPINAQEVSLAELHDRVRTLARQCRCRACFDCLRRAGSLPWCQI